MAQEQSNEALKYKIDLMAAETEELIQNEHIYRTALNMSDDAFVYEDLIKESRVVSDGFYKMFGIKKMPLNTTIFLKSVCDKDKKLLYDASKEDNNKLDGRILEFRLADSSIWVMAKISINKDEEGKAVEKIIFFRNITELKRKNEELRYMAFYDSLTGLYNRNYFVRMLSETLVKAELEGAVVSVLYIDIDDFKVINDTLGMLFADEVIQYFANDLREIMASNMFAGRMNNDEFCLAIINPDKLKNAENIYEMLRGKAQQNYRLINGREVSITISAGASEYPECGSNSLELVRNAEIAVYKVKKSGKNNICFFDNDMHNEFLASIEFEKQLSDAVSNEEFILFYQPQFDAYTSELRGVEALIRWQRPDGTIIPPDIFIPASEKNGTIVMIGDWVIDKAAATAAKWQDRYGFKGVMSVNISTVQIRKDDFVRKIKEVINKYNLPPESIEIEITESVLIEDLDGIVDKINKLRAYGVKVSLDDFGTGYSSLSYLKSMPIDTLKIDKSFIDSVITDRSTNIITQSVIEMVKKLGVSTVAEGVESREQFEYLKDINCDNIQGYLMGKPMNENNIEEIIKNL